MIVGRLITLYTAVMSLGKLVKRLNLLFRVVVVKSTSLRSRRLKGKVGGGGGGGGRARIGHTSARQCYSDM